jgi:Arc/MetJ family transcription regulator
MVATPPRKIRIEDELWTASSDQAAGRSETVSDIVRLALRAYVTDPTATIVALTQIRGGA